MTDFFPNNLAMFASPFKTKALHQMDDENKSKQFDKCRIWPVGLLAH